MLKLDDDLTEKYKTDEMLEKIADKIFMNVKEVKVRKSNIEKNKTRRQLYNLGLSDKQIAKSEGVCPTSITHWRLKHELGANSKKQLDAKMLELYNKGLNDSQISRELQVSRETVQYWRSTHELDKQTGGKLLEKRHGMLRSGMSIKEIAEKEKCKPNYII